MDIENHPIPQDITGFQFKLIGNMTLKQFAYLAGGFILAWVAYVSPIFWIVKIIIALLFASVGAILAFLPIEGRPLDIMIVNFIKAVFRPTQYVYQQANVGLAEKELKSVNDFNKKRQTISEMSEEQLQLFLKTLPKATSKVDKKEMVFFQNINQYQKAAPAQTLPGFVPQHAFANTAPQVLEQSLPPLPGTRPIKKEVPDVPTAAVDAEKNTKQEITPTIQEQTSQPTQIVQNTQSTQAAQDEKNAAQTQQFLDAHQKVLELQKNLNDSQVQKQQLEEKLIQLQKQMTISSQSVVTPTIAKQEQPQTQLVRSIPQNMTKSVGLIATPEFPNVISGIVKDPRGNPLANILVEVKDMQGNAARAFKTNALGQFASATALMNGEYTMEFEDAKGQNKFEIVGFKATGDIILPIEITSVDTREELRRSLFN